MLLSFHIAFGVISILFASLAFIYPSKTKLTTTFLFTFATVLSGIGLVLFQHVNVVRVCLTGINYLVVIFYLSISTLKKLGLSLNMIEYLRGNVFENNTNPYKKN